MDIEAVIDEVGRRHHLRLTPDDPILATITVLEAVHQSLVARLESVAAKNADSATFRLAAEIEKAGRAAREEIQVAQDAAVGLMNQAGAWSADELRKGAEHSARDVEAAVNRSLSAALSRLNADVQTAQTARKIAVWSAAGAVFLCTILLAAAVGFWLGGRA